MKEDIYTKIMLGIIAGALIVQIGLLIDAKLNRANSPNVGPIAVRIVDIDGHVELPVRSPISSSFFPRGGPTFDVNIATINGEPANFSLNTINVNLQEINGRAIPTPRIARGDSPSSIGSLPVRIVR